METRVPQRPQIMVVSTGQLSMIYRCSEVCVDFKYLMHGSSSSSCPYKKYVGNVAAVDGWTLDSASCIGQVNPRSTPHTSGHHRIPTAVALDQNTVTNARLARELEYYFLYSQTNVSFLIFY
jgi:hypothetical protein